MTHQISFSVKSIIKQTIEVIRNNLKIFFLGYLQLIVLEVLIWFGVLILIGADNFNRIIALVNTFYIPIAIPKYVLSLNSRVPQFNIFQSNIFGNCFVVVVAVVLSLIIAVAFIRFCLALYSKKKQINVNLISYVLLKPIVPYFIVQIIMSLLILGTRMSILLMYPVSIMLMGFLGKEVAGIFSIAAALILINSQLYLFVRIVFAEYFVIDRNIGIIDALRLNWHATQGIALQIAWKLIGLYLILLGCGGLLFLVIYMITDKVDQSWFTLLNSMVIPFSVTVYKRLEENLRLQSNTHAE